MEKYKNITELQSYQIITPMTQDMYDDELFHAVCASNCVAVDYFLQRIDDTYLNACELLSSTEDITVAELILVSIQYKIFRRLNACLSKIKSLDVLQYLVGHDIAVFNIGYKKSECVRMATLTNDIERVKCFLDTRSVRSFDLCTRGLNTMDKSCVELAYYNKNDEMLKLFISSGLDYSFSEFSYELREHLVRLNNIVCIGKNKNKRQILRLFISGVDIDDIGVQVMDSAFPECLGNDIMYTLRTKRLIRSIYGSDAI